MKSGELNKRAERREEAQKSLEKAEEAGNFYRLWEQNSNMFPFTKIIIFAGDAACIDKFNRRLVKVTKKHVEECKELLKLMGIPYVEVCRLSIRIQFVSTVFKYKKLKNI